MYMNTPYTFRATCDQQERTNEQTNERKKEEQTLNFHT